MNHEIAAAGTGLKRLWVYGLGFRQRRRKRDDRAKFNLAVECIVANLASVALMGPDVVLAVPRSSWVMWGSARYASPVYGQHFLDALALMALPGVAIAESVAGGFRLPDGRKQASTIRPTARLRAETDIAALG